MIQPIRSARKHFVIKLAVRTLSVFVCPSGGSDFLWFKIGNLAFQHELIETKEDWGNKHLATRSYW